MASKHPPLSTKIPPTDTEMSIVGVVADVKREYQNDFIAERCCVYGIDREEFQAMEQVAEVRPRQFEDEAERYEGKIFTVIMMMLLSLASAPAVASILVVVVAAATVVVVAAAAAAVFSCSLKGHF